jgi:hypothetical protein
MPPISIVLLVVFFVAGFLEARRFAETYGRAPWGWSPVFWGAVLGLVWPIGLVLLAIAERVGRKQAKTRLSPQPAVSATGDPHGPAGTGENILPKL